MSEPIQLPTFDEPIDPELVESFKASLADASLDLSGAHLAGTCDPPCGETGRCGFFEFPF